MSEMWSKMYVGLHAKYSLFLIILAKLEVSRQSCNKTHASNLMKIRPVGADFIVSMRIDGLTDGETDMTKPITTFSNFALAPKNSYFFFSETTNKS